MGSAKIKVVTPIGAKDGAVGFDLSRRPAVRLDASAQIVGYVETDERHAQTQDYTGSEESLKAGVKRRHNKPEDAGEEGTHDASPCLSPQAEVRSSAGHASKIQQ
jgi:hypothetical protein